MFTTDGKFIATKSDLIKEYVGVMSTCFLATIQDQLIIAYKGSPKLFVFSPELKFIRSIDIGVFIKHICSDRNHLYVLTKDKEILTF